MRAWDWRVKGERENRTDGGMQDRKKGSRKEEKFEMKKKSDRKRKT